MSVVGSPADSVIIPRHYGSGYAMVDHKTNSHNLFISGSLAATPQLRLHGMVAYNLSTSKFDEVEFPVAEIEERLISTKHPAGDLEDHNFTFTNLDEYSELDYQLLRFSLGLEYLLAPGITVTADGEFADLTDDGVYVYGDESGSFYMIRTGVRLDF